MELLLARVSKEIWLIAIRMIPLCDTGWCMHLLGLFYARHNPLFVRYSQSFDCTFQNMIEAACDLCQISRMQSLPSQTVLFLAAITLVAGLIFPPMSAYTAVYVTLAALVCGIILCWRDIAHLLAMRSFMVVLYGFVLYLLTEPFRWHGPDDLLILAVFLPVLLAGGLVLLLCAEPRLATPFILAALCLTGALGAFFVALNDVLVLNIGRAGGGNNPIHFADLTVTLGFMVLIGLFVTKSAWRFVFLAGPLLAVAVALLSGTRGAVMTILLVSMLLVVVFSIWQRSVRPALFVLATFVIIGAAGFALRPDTITRAEDGLRQSIAATNILLFDQENGEAPVGIDASTDVRVIMIRSAWQAFLDAPVFGHGAGQIIDATRPYFPERHKDIGAHLHADWADFLVAGGLVGFGAYLFDPMF
jgi:O-antigen ligase